MRDVDYKRLIKILLKKFLYNSSINFSQIKALGRKDIENEK